MLGQRPLWHEGCGQECRYLTLEASDPRGLRVQLTHSVWLRVLEKHGSGMDAFRSSVSSAISAPHAIHADTRDSKGLMYYEEPPALDGKLLCVAVKCLPYRIRDRELQRRYRMLGRAMRTGYGEAWVSTVHIVPREKSFGSLIWPS